ncbi:VOC family protein [Clavibacter nebraskensis]|uniref:VOC family protein n=2 Tax=Clavibacter nebraskensis TaxID=31963 RepID=A0A399Q0P6_9MICO|nr:VOC family protein [Clavibacter nebraskensis]KXU20720.1 glyoxalase [Clavibacter nebraskensis]OAH20515.1 glyoxalase [Clavibacter nebraskensis]QGV66703.1 VOC family protein [Clavibacter nebraskensis]QGV69500.1 VOC family protein [Clavibacter nebraskensis]QGV72290.1 VOC family protein [Clavibacter nebraskensis]
MSARIRHVAIDCGDPHALSLFWAGVTGFAEDPDEPNLPGEDVAWLGDPVSGLGIILQRAETPKTAKNRLHLDLAPDDRTRDEEVDRVLGLGASLVADRRNADGSGWVVLADPNGNEFCVERSDAEREAGDEVGAVVL